MEPSQELVDAIYRERVLRARAAPRGEDKLADALRLSDLNEIRLKAGIRHQFPHLTEQQIQKLCIERVNRLRQLDAHLWTIASDSPE